MADQETLKSPAEIDREAIDKFNRRLKQDLEREARLNRHYEWRGNKLPPFNIEPMPYARQRLADGGMTPEQRAMRKQWVQDQALSPSEPRPVRELQPRNPIRRALATPWDILFRMLRPIVGERVTVYGRYVTPRLAIFLSATWLMWYNLKYHPADWTSGSQGWHSYSTKPMTLPGDALWPEGPKKMDDDFFDKGFKQRNALKDVQPSAV